VTLLDQIRQTIARYAMLCTGERLGVAVSGGADSLGLLHALLELRAEYGLELSVIHIDHNLRGAESQADAQFVHNIAQQFGLPWHLRTLDLIRQSGNLEQEARRARYRIFAELVRGGVVHKVALGHTRSDQAETVLFRLLRGAGSAGLAGIRPVTNSGTIRPLLQVTRAQVEDWLKERKVPWREDSTNAELRFDRNRLRHRLIPQLQAEWNPGLPETLAQVADWAFEEEQYWRQELPRLTADWVRFAKGTAVLDARRLKDLPVAVARRLIREIVERVKGDLLGVGFRHIEGIRELAALPVGRGRLQIAAVEVVRSFHWLRFSTLDDGSEDWQVNLTVPGSYVVPCTTYGSFLSAKILELERVRNNGVYNRDVNALDLDRAGEQDGGSLVLRNWRAGDQYQRQGHAGPEKIKQLFQEFQIPSWERQSWPIITVGRSIAWVSKFGPAAQFAVDEKSSTVLSIRESHQTGGKA